MEKPDLSSKEGGIVNTFSNLSPKVHDLVLDFITSGMTIKEFLESLKGIPGHNDFFKRLRAGTKVRVLRSSGFMDNEGWIIDPSVHEEDLGSQEGMVNVHNKALHIEKLVPLNDLIAWNIDL
jgi:hypothetical protein